MAESLYEVLLPYLEEPGSASPPLAVQDNVTAKYLTRLSTLPLNSLTSTEPESLNQFSHTNNLSLQALSARSNASVVTSSGHLSSLSKNIPQLTAKAEVLRNDVPKLDEQAVGFSEKYSRNIENEVLERRKISLMMARNVDRLSDVLDLPTLLSSTIATSTGQGASNANSYASALDLHSHIKRLYLLHSESAIVGSIYRQTEEAMQEMTSNLIASLRSQNIKLAAGMRTTGWLRRIAPELDGSEDNKEGSLGALFLVCRLATLISMLSALEPLRDLADQETTLRKRDMKNGTLQAAKDSWSYGQQTERYLKRYIEIFREQSFAIVSMYKSVFPSAPDAPNDANFKVKSPGLRTEPASHQNGVTNDHDPLNSRPSALATFPLHLVGLLSSTLQDYLPNVRDKSSRESLLTQVLYCAGSLGRLGGDFSMILASMNGNEDYDSDETDEDDGIEWTNVMKKHRVLASKLEKMASGAS